MAWKKGRGKLGLLHPLLGSWVAESDSPMGPLRCTRSFSSVLGGNYVHLEARWEFSAVPGSAQSPRAKVASAGMKQYQEIAIFGVGDDGAVAFWSFTSDGKHSQGKVTDVTDIHKDAIGFEAQMPAGLARMAYWPDGAAGFHWVVEARNAKGWRRFTEHHYRPA